MEMVTSSQSRNRRRLMLVVPLSILAAAMIVGAVVVGRDTGIVGGDPPAWAAALGGVLQLGGLALTIATLVWLVRSGRFRADRESLLRRLHPSDTRSLQQQVRRGAPQDDADFGLLRAAARTMINQSWYSMVLLGFVISSFGQVLLKFTPLFTGLFAVMATLGVGAVAFSFRDASRAKAFLCAHPEPEEQESHD
ncbi:hypothetical protein [Micromonospora noduli]|uniref:Uncharacterized protein n=1 Tax=Micromonospora noduli TaxID=709876 RepID=A0A328N7T5_9ACTN|nr:hypothetical protein [Micromonospora noduli]RAO04563.1 hypothetical protein LAH08_01323 [Micromonospora noduli]RAO07610.1 hypothetical protein LUPAC07_06185 [Micromonospora noduli]RAO10219.1 hypothetical protein GUI43_03532 [Micromonospora noduli]